MKISVVMPAYNEAPSLAGLISEVIATLEASDVEPEIVVVDDGSTDETVEIVRRLGQRDPRVRLVSLSRNFGHQAALVAGLRLASGAAVISMDADGQHPAAVLPELIAAWREGAHVVHTVRSMSADVGWFKRATSRVFYRFFRWLSGLDLRDGMADFRLLSRQALDALLAASGTRPFLRGAAVWIGFRHAVIEYQARERTHGATSYSLRAMSRLARDGIIGFSERPLFLMSQLGLFASGIAFVIAIYAVIVGLVDQRAVPGWASTLALLSFLMGWLFALMSLLSAYVARIFAEVIARPVYLVAQDSSDLDSQQCE